MIAKTAITIFHFALAQKLAALHSDPAFQASSPIQTFIGQSFGIGLFFVWRRRAQH
jgi:hypothetical protein